MRYAHPTQTPPARVVLTWPALDCGIILNYQDPENFAVALLDAEAGGTFTPRYVEFIEGQKQEAKGNYGTSFTLTLDTAAAAARPGSRRDQRAALGPPCQGLTAGQTYGVQAVVRAQYPANAVRLYVDRNQDGDFADQDELVLTNFMIFGTWGGGHVGLYRATSTTTTTLQWDNFLCGYDVDNDEVIGTVTNPDPGDYLYARYTFDDPGGGVTWQTIAYTHDANGNLTGDGLYKYTYDAWNRLAGVWYHDCAVDGNGVPSDANERVARYRYDGLFRRVSKQVTNQGTGVVFRSDDLDRNGTPDATGILAGDRHEHYYYAGWRLVETTNHVTGGGGYSYGDSAVLNQFVYGTQYIDEPVRYDRNTDASSDDDCLDAGGSRAYFYHQDANWRTVALTGEDGQIVERVEYTAYGEPTLFGGTAPAGGDDDAAAAAGELGNAMLVSTVGNPFLHQGLFRDRETRTYHNRFRQYDSRSGRFMQRDPLYSDVLTPYEYVHAAPWHYVDPFGLQESNPTTKPRPDEYPLPPEVEAALERAWKRSFTTDEEGRQRSREAGGTIVKDKDGNIKVINESTATRSGLIQKDMQHDPGETIVGTFHTHPYTEDEQWLAKDYECKDHGFCLTDSDIQATGGQWGNVKIIRDENCVFVLVVTDSQKAQDCHNDGRIPGRAYRDARDKCLNRTPKSDPCRNKKCSEEGAAAAADACGYDLYKGCGDNKSNPKKISGGAK